MAVNRWNRAGTNAAGTNSKLECSKMLAASTSGGTSEAGMAWHQSHFTELRPELRPELRAASKWSAMRKASGHAIAMASGRDNTKCDSLQFFSLGNAALKLRMCLSLALLLRFPPNRNHWHSWDFVGKLRADKSLVSAVMTCIRLAKSL